MNSTPAAIPVRCLQCEHRKHTMKCYVCDKEAVSKEHSPPECFFPVGHKSNLIKVPSCREHNEKTSDDDEYTRNLILLTKGNNEIAALHFHKVKRSFQRSPKLYQETFKDSKHLNTIKDNENTKSLAAVVDRIRFERVMRKTAYGLYYHNFKRTWEYGLSISTRHLFTENSDVDEEAVLLELHRNPNFKIDYKGSNPEVFKYSFLNFSFSTHKLLVMKFYDWFEVYAVPKLSSNCPSIE